MQIKLKLLTLGFCFLFCINVEAKENTICVTSAINEIIKSNYADDTQIKDLWTKLDVEHIVRIKDSDANVRPQMVKIQYLIESSIASLLKNGNIKYSKAVIYTPLPSTPLRATDTNLNTLVKKDFYKDKNRMNSIVLRRTSTKQYLTNGGILYNLHKIIRAEEEDKIPGLNIYKENIRRYKTTLVDKPISNISTRYTGASYIAECKDGTKMFFSIRGRQAQNTKKRQWSLYYGQLNDTKINNYYKKMQNLYKKEADVPFNFQQSHQTKK